MILLSNSSLEPRKIGIKPIKFKELKQTFPHAHSGEGISKEDQLKHKHQQLAESIQEQELKLQSIKTEAENELTLARETIQAEQAAWDEEKQSWIEEARKKGYQLGYEEGENQAFQDFNQRIRKATAIIHQAEEEREVIIDQAEADILKLAMSVAEKIVKQSIIEKDAALELVKAAIKECHNQAIIRIYVSVDDFELVNTHTDDLLRMLDEGVTLSVHPDETQQEGICIIETPNGKLDVSVDVQLDKINRTLMEYMEEMHRED